MRSFLFAVFVSLLAGCAGSGGYSRTLSPDVARTVYFEPLELDSAGVNSYVELALVRAGFEPVSKPEAANYRLKMSYDWNIYNMTALARMTDTKTGNTVYLGEGKNRGFGTALATNSSMHGCIDRALDNLK